MFVGYSVEVCVLASQKLTLLGLTALKLCLLDTGNGFYVHFSAVPVLVDFGFEAHFVARGNVQAAPYVVIDFHFNAAAGIAEDVVFVAYLAFDVAFQGNVAVVRHAAQGRNAGYAVLVARCPATVPIV